MLSPSSFITQVKPACETFIRSPTRINLDALRNELNRTDDNTLDRFHSYILVPLLMKMDMMDERNEELKIDVVTTLDHLIRRIRIKDKSAIKTILLVCLKQIYDFGSAHVKTAPSEDLKAALVQCMSSALQSASFDCLETFYVKENGRFIGDISLACVEFTDKEKFRKLRIAAIELLMSAFYVHDHADFSDVELRNSAADIVFVFLPKIVQTLITVANGDEKQGQQVIATSVKALHRILCLIFEDYHRDQNMHHIQAKDFAELVRNSTTANKSDDEILGNQLKSLPTEERLKTMQNLQRNQAWFGASSRKLLPIFRRMAILRANASNQIRHEYALMCCTLVEKCHQNLTENMSAFIETIFALSQDQDEAIRNMCAKFLTKINNDSQLSAIVFDNVTNLFETHLISLPRIINRWEDSEQIAEFLFLKGILENCTDSCLSTVFCVPNNVERLCECLIAAVELELDNDLLKDEYAIRDVAEESGTGRPCCWRKFKKIGNDQIVRLIQSICEIIGRSKIADLVFDHLIERLAEDTAECNEIILILIMMFSRCSKSESRASIMVVLEELLQERRWALDLQPNRMKRLTADGPSNWHVDRTPGLYESAIEVRTQDMNPDGDDDDTDTPATITIADARFHVLHICLILDAIGHFTLLIGNRFQPFMYRALHRVLQKAGSCNYAVHQAGMFALKSIVAGLKLNTIPELIQENSNYISYHVNFGLRKPESSKSSFDILSTILQYSSYESVSHLENIIVTILEEASRLEQSSNIESFLKVFHMFLVGVIKWVKASESIEDPPEVDESEKTGKSDDELDLYGKWVEILNKEHHDGETLNIDDANFKDEPMNDPDEMETNFQPEEEEPPKKILPRHIQIVSKILKEVLKFLSSKDQMHKIISLECLTTGLPILKDYEDELLPIVHLIWTPFVQRFKDKDVIVLNRCFTLLEVLAVHAKDFLLQRTLKDVFPFLCDFLHDSSKNSLGKSYLVQTQEFKLQLKLLIEYPTLIVSMDVTEREFDRISEAVLLYLDKRQPKLLQENAVDYFKKMSVFNCPAVYIKLASQLTNSDMEENVRHVIEALLEK